MAQSVLAPNLHQNLEMKSANMSASPYFYDKMNDFERTVLHDEYALCEQNVSRMAIKLGMNRSHLHMKLKEHQIK